MILGKMRGFFLGCCIALAPGFAGAQEPSKPEPPPARQGAFEFKLKEAGLTSAGIFDAQGKLVCPLWSLKTLEAGPHSGHWYYRDSFNRPLTGTDYELRVVINRGKYENVGIIGNTGNTQATHTPGAMKSVAVDPQGSIYTANDWEEAGADFKKWDRRGKSLFDANFQIRNGNPNGAPYAITADDDFLYCAVYGWDTKPNNSRQQIQRFRSRDGQLEPFTEVSDNGGHIQLYEWPEKKIPRGASERDVPLMKQPLRALAVREDLLYVTDALGGKIHVFHKKTGKLQGGFPVRLPMALAVGTNGRIWVGHEHSKVTAFDPDGANATLMIEDLEDISGLAIGRDNRLYVADKGAGLIKIYETDQLGARLVDTFGQRARPGDYAPDRFFQLEGVAVDSQGSMVTIQSQPFGGARLARWLPDRKLDWEQRGLEFVSLGTYSSRNPDEFISLYYNRYRLEKTGTPRAEYRGNLQYGDPKYRERVHGVPRIVALGNHSFFYTAQGDGMLVFRREGDSLRLAAMVGGRCPDPQGKSDDKAPLGQWTWNDRNGNGSFEHNEIVWYKKPGSGKYIVFGFNVDDRGNLLYCEHETGAIWELPLLGLDERGNPRYDWHASRVVVPRDRSPAQLLPLMAVRGDDGQLYAFCRSKYWTEPKNGGAWMAGWALSCYGRRGDMLWVTQLPQMCVGLDYIPGGGVLLAWFEKGHIYHYSRDGLLVGTVVPGAAAGGITGWLDNTAALAAARDPRDHLVDVFTSDNFLYRLLWYRIDDSKLETIRAKITE